MTSEKMLSASLVDVKFNESFTEAVLRLNDSTRLCFRHRVGERWVKAVGPEQNEDEAGQAGEFLANIAMFRLNAKHLDIQFTDGSRWDQNLREFGRLNAD